MATHIEWILIVTGVATATMLSQFFAPLPVLRLIYGEAPTDVVSLALARHWGLLIFCVGALLIYAAFYPLVSAPIPGLRCDRESRSRGVRAGHIVAQAGYCSRACRD